MREKHLFPPLTFFPLMQNLNSSVPLSLCLNKLFEHLRTVLKTEVRSCLMTSNFYNIHKTDQREKYCIIFFISEQALANTILVFFAKKLSHLSWACVYPCVKLIYLRNFKFFASKTCLFVFCSSNKWRSIWRTESYHEFFDKRLQVTMNIDIRVKCSTKWSFWMNSQNALGR